jgi:predicted RNase H-like HicB family nuclease
MKFTIIIEPTATGFSGYSPDIPGCGAAGSTIEETKQNLKEAILFHLEGLKEQGEPWPTPTSQADYIEITLAA